MHPNPIQIFQLWQIYLDNVHPLLKPLHAPTVQQQLLKSVNDLTSVPPSMHALLFAVYSAAVLSMRDGASLETLGYDKQTMRSRFNAAARYALKKAGFLRSSDRIVFQAMVLIMVRIFKLNPFSSLLFKTGLRLNAIGFIYTFEGTLSVDHRDLSRFP